MSSDPNGKGVPPGEQDTVPEARRISMSRDSLDEPTRTNRRALPDEALPSAADVIAAQDVPAPNPAAPGEAQGIGRAPAHHVETLPPLEEMHRGVPVSPRTGEPRRTGALVALQCCLYAAAVASGLGYALYWWRAMHVENFDRSAWVVGLLDPRPGSAGSIVLVIVLALLVVVMVGAPAVAAYQAWTGERFAQTLSLVALGVAFLGALFNPLACLAVPLAAVGVALSRSSGVTSYFDAWEALRAPVHEAEATGRRVFYGRLPRFQ
ncbi:hypothetical protein [Propionibacterium australiense]|uniref:Uncharacterized protein n=1 Tax=Propionibacterium australiense TaxID=119981 RepID=A0A383SB18_9ACTN|nr:hypothetical protein [Propionibacterium australiense]RLP06236.1 hypothetical protein D9T14_12630 [Propionibacterium australiense]RLP07574.1 hypothetical protein D7U36_11250 [Propionibacterium australiense]SYZ34569.1 Hypothetical protein PROPAUS_2587 [Propionibacterium australiense]VEH92706.1 Uncharacterised protein [Propionibacterium australiense]